MRSVDARRRGLETSPPDPERLADLVLHGVLNERSGQC